MAAKRRRRRKSGAEFFATFCAFLWPMNSGATDRLPLMDTHGALTRRGQRPCERGDWARRCIAPGQSRAIAGRHRRERSQPGFTFFSSRSARSSDTESTGVEPTIFCHREKGDRTGGHGDEPIRFNMCSEFFRVFGVFRGLKPLLFNCDPVVHPAQRAARSRTRPWPHPMMDRARCIAGDLPTKHSKYTKT
jgi:hypothetical protein